MHYDVKNNKCISFLSHSWALQLDLKLSVKFTIGAVDIYAGNTVDGKEQQGKIDNKEEFLRKQLKEKFDNFED